MDGDRRCSFFLGGGRARGKFWYAHDGHGCTSGCNAGGFNNIWGLVRTAFSLTGITIASHILGISNVTYWDCQEWLETNTAEGVLSCGGWWWSLVQLDIRVYLLNTVTRGKIEQKTLFIHFNLEVKTLQYTHLKTLEIHPFWDAEKSTVTTSILHLTPWTLLLGVAWSIESTSTGYWPGDLVVTVRYGCVLRIQINMEIYIFIFDFI